MQVQATQAPAAQAPASLPATAAAPATLVVAQQVTSGQAVQQPPSQQAPTQKAQQPSRPSQPSQPSRPVQAAKPPASAPGSTASTASPVATGFTQMPVSVPTNACNGNGGGMAGTVGAAGSAGSASGGDGGTAQSTPLPPIDGGSNAQAGAGDGTTTAGDGGQLQAALPANDGNGTGAAAGTGDGSVPQPAPLPAPNDSNAAAKAPPAREVYYLAELNYYMIMQGVYHQLGPEARAFHINTMKHLRPILQMQREHLKDGPLKDKLLTFSPALYPDRPNAPPDLPEITKKILDNMDNTINLEATANGGVRKLPRLVDGWFHPDDLMPHLGFVRAGSNAVTGGTSHPGGYKRAYNLSDFDDDECSDALVEDQYGNLRRPSKRARFADGGDSYDEDYDSDISAEPIDPSRFSPSGSESDEPGNAAGKTGRPRKHRMTARRLRHNRYWYELPYEARLDKLGLGMSRDDRRVDRDLAYGHHGIQNPFALSLDELIRGSDDEDNDIVSDDADEFPADPNDPPGAPYETWEEAMRCAPDDYVNLKSYFLWEKRHKRRAPAVLNQDILPYVPFLPAFPHPSDDAYNGFLPVTGPEGPDDEWVSIPDSDDSDGDSDGGDGGNGNADGGDGGGEGAPANKGTAVNAGTGSAAPAAPVTTTAVPPAPSASARSTNTTSTQTSPSALRVMAPPIRSVVSIASSASFALSALVSRQPQNAPRPPIVWRPGMARDVNDALNRLSMMQLELDGLQRGIAGVQSSVTGLHDEVESLEQDLVKSRPDSQSEDRVSTIQADLGGVQKGMDGLKHGFSGLNDEMISLKKDLVHWLQENKAAGRRSL
ncbi:hypothetical protein SBRCBS47491_001675 [Sporothrix bragantina]|uniref:Uncharacterized protein n=1 Tax=Sporothrix bragantina TaxID=671064 RepID=A0ABP0B0G7_9PEZI